jgi:hypothetical protein
VMCTAGLWSNTEYRVCCTERHRPLYFACCTLYAQNTILRCKVRVVVLSGDVVQNLNYICIWPTWDDLDGISYEDLIFYFSKTIIYILTNLHDNYFIQIPNVYTKSK